jgi:hypothetical protein
VLQRPLRFTSVTVPPPGTTIAARLSVQEAGREVVSGAHVFWANAENCINTIAKHIVANCNVLEKLE